MREDELSHDLITAELIIKAIDEPLIRSALKMNGFEIEPIKSWDWIVRGCRVSAHTAMTWGESPERESNTDIGARLQALSKDTNELWEKLNKLSPDQDNAILEYAYRNWNDDGRGELENGEAAVKPSEFKKFVDAVSLLDWMSGFLDRAAGSVVADKQTHKWPDKERLQRRIVLARCLSTIFEDGFGKKPTTNRFRTASDATLMGQWPIFWQSVAYLIWDENASPNLGTLFRNAGKMHKHKRVEFIETSKGD